MCNETARERKLKQFWSDNMNGDVSWGYMVAFLAGDFRDEITALIIADSTATAIGKVTRRKSKG